MISTTKKNRQLEGKKMKTKECYFYKKDEEKIECVATLHERKDVCDCEERFITLSRVGYDSFDRLDENEIQNGMSLEEIFEEIPTCITGWALK